MQSRFVVPLLALVLGSCASASGRLERLFEDLRSDVEDVDPLRGPDEEFEKRLAEHAHDAREIVDSGASLSALDRFHAAALLVQTVSVPDLELAARLGREAGDRGETRGYRVAAEAIDKRAMVRDEPQTFGTQYVFEETLGSWRLYKCNPKTTDLERSRMGVPTYAELLRAEDELNDSTGRKARPR